MKDEAGRSKDETINIRYHFTMKDGKEEIVDLCLHEKTLNLMNDVKAFFSPASKKRFYTRLRICD
jgi:hypothetical protein